MRFLPALIAVTCLLTAVPALPAAPLAQGKQKFLGGIYSAGQEVGIPLYWNQVVPENAGKWGSVEATRNVMNWTELDAAYIRAKSNGLPFRFHVLFWGAQQPAWMRDLSDADQLAEIREWLAAVAARYPDIDYLEVVNEAFHDQPDSTWKWLTFVDNSTDPNCGNYKKALGGNGATGWDWVLNAFRLARQYFPSTKLMLNDYGIISDGNATNQYIALITLLKAENLVDVVAEQAHAFNTSGTAATTLTANLNSIGATGLPIWITELDIDGPTTDEAQRAEYERVFPALWNNPYVIGITTWGYRPGLWRNAQGAYIVLADGTERAAMTWLKTYVTSTTPNLRALLDRQPTNQTVAAGGSATFTVTARGTPAPTYQWQKNGVNLPGATAASLALTAISPADSGATYRVIVTNPYATVTSSSATLTVGAPAISFTTQPTSRTARVGESVSFTVVASGTSPLTYQWSKDAVTIPGASGSTLTLTNLQFSQAGAYSVLVSNASGSATSETATLTVVAAATGDFNRDGKADLIWSNSITGERTLWLMDGTQFIGSSTLGSFPLEWTIAATGDFNFDGQPDIVWSNSVTGERALWLMNGTALLGTSTLGIFPLEWTVAATGDFNFDGKPDLVWSNSQTGERALWLMNGTTLLGTSTLGVFPLEWTVAATGDFNFDGKPDLVWSNSKTGERALWLMNGTTFLGASTLGVFPLEWTVAGTGDYNGDGKPDLIWSNSITGERALWLMNGTIFLGASTLGIFPLEWTVQN